MSKAANTGNGYPSGMKNRIINGDMTIAQRATSFAAANAYTLDRWSFGQATDSVVTVTQNSDVPSNLEFQNSLRATVTTADASIGAGQYAFVQQPIEGYNIRDLTGRTFTISFWVKSTKMGIHNVRLQNGGLDRVYVAEYTVNASLTWEYKTITITGGLPSTGTWNYTNGVGFYLCWNLACGTTYQTTAGSWNTGSLVGTAGQVNVLDTIGNIFAITGVQLELGPVATPFEHRLFGAELALCQRYFEKSFNYDVVPGAVSALGAIFFYGSSDNAGNLLSNGRFIVQKRTTPIMTFYNGSTGTVAQVAYARSGASGNATANEYQSGAMGYGVYVGLAVAFVTGNLIYHYTASAEL